MNNTVAQAPAVPTPAGQTNAGAATQTAADGSTTQAPVSTDGRVREETDRRRAQAAARAAAASTILTAPLGLTQLANIGKAKLGG